MKRRLLVLSTYPEISADARFRAVAYFQHLEAAGIQCDFAPFCDADFLRMIHRPGRRVRKAFDLARFSLARLGVLLRGGRYDAVFVQREAALIGPALVESVLATILDVPLVYDLDDAIWLDATQATGVSASAHPLARRLLKVPSKTDRLLQMATTVVAGSSFLATYARRFNSDVAIVPTVVSRERWHPLPGRLDGRMLNEAVPTIGWIGSHSTAVQLDLVVLALQRLAREGNKFRVRIIGSTRRLPIEGVDCENPRWSLEREIEDFQTIDIGLAPMFANEWGEGKCGFKQIQYMAVGVPMVTSLVGGARDFVVDGTNALVAHDDEAWYRHLKTLLDERSVRARLAREGRALVEQRLCTEVQADRIVSIVDAAMRRSHAPVSRGP